MSHLSTRHSPPDNSVPLSSCPDSGDLPLVHAEVHQVVVRTVDCGDWTQTNLAGSDCETNQQELTVLVEAEVQCHNYLLALSAHNTQLVSLSSWSEVPASLRCEGDQVGGHDTVEGLQVPNTQLVISAHSNRDQTSQVCDGAREGLILPLLGGK